MGFKENVYHVIYLLADQVSLPDCIYFLRYWAICVLQLFVFQGVTS